MPKTKIIAHKGASGHAPENTMAAFQLALDHRADGFELDVKLSKDGHVVVIHDSTVDRTTNGTGRVNQLTLTQLQALDAGNGERIPTLEEVLTTFGWRCLINIELKNYVSPFDRLPIAVAELLNNNGYANSVMISTFNPFNLRRFRKRCSTVKLGLLTERKLAKYRLWQLFPHDALYPHFSDVNQGLVEAVHAEQREINVWTVDDPHEIRRLAGLNVDGIITNHPQMAREALEAVL
jgi:glycerophosphoryl diester phosphodiesterase